MYIKKNEKKSKNKLRKRFVSKIDAKDWVGVCVTVLLRPWYHISKIIRRKWLYTHIEKKNGRDGCDKQWVGAEVEEQKRCSRWMTVWTIHIWNRLTPMIKRSDGTEWRAKMNGREWVKRFDFFSKSSFFLGSASYSTYSPRCIKCYRNSKCYNFAGIDFIDPKWKVLKHSFKFCWWNGGNGLYRTAQSVNIRHLRIFHHFFSRFKATARLQDDQTKNH